MESKMVPILIVLGLCALATGSPLSNPDPRSLKNYSFVRIVGGKDASIADYPYQVSVRFDDQHGCGGSILTNRFILTAAHCFVQESRVSHITIQVGSSNRNSGGRIYATKKINAHPNFNEDTFDNDVAVVELASTLTFGTGVQPIQLASSTTPQQNGQTTVVTGWGLTSENGQLADVLQVVNIPLIITATCQTRYYGDAVTSRMICAGAAGKDSCVGDSGGPLVSQGVQIGIVSWGDVCGQASTPGVYTKVTEFLSYINGVINN